MIVVDVLLAANLAVLAVLVVADRSRNHRARPVEVLAAARAVRRKAVKSPEHAPACGGVIIPFDAFDRATHRGVAVSAGHHPVAAASLRHPAGGGLRH
jgi:hypothetical protein